MSETCKTCRRPKAQYHCGPCQESVCKACSHFVGVEAFSFLKKIPQELTHDVYCTACFEEIVSTPLSAYNEVMEKAKDIIIYRKDQSKLTRFLKRKEAPYTVKDCEDEEEAIMRMAFFAAEAGFNCLIDVQFDSKKIVLGSHKKTIHSGSAVPITIDPQSIRGHEDPP